ncbi:hypothetical protein Q9Q99_06035 [Curtobacterium flaccumfaciens]|nr:hypothetical protein Q9Q99_06035 [Curtobacterium flaccumfaciens]
MAYHNRLGVTNVDGISYMGIAREYANGWLPDAINAYWSPLVSWMMAPFVALGLGLQTAFAIVNCFAAAVVLGIGGWLVWSQNHRIVPALVFMVTAIPALMSAVPVQTPDLLVVAGVVGFLWALRWADQALHGSTRARVVSGAVLGAVAALGYFTKLFLLPVAIGAVILWLLLRVWSARRRHEPVRHWWTAPVATIVVFVVVIAPWVGALTAKYDTVTLGSSLSVNIGSKFDDGGRATDWPFLPVPPNDHAFSPNEDFTPSVYKQGPMDNPDPAVVPPATSSSSDDTAPKVTKESGIAARAGYYLHERMLALPYYLQKISTFAPFAAPIALLFAAALVIGVVRFRRYAFTCIVAATTLVYFVGYGMITSSSSGGGNALLLAALLPDRDDRCAHAAGGLATGAPSWRGADDRRVPGDRRGAPGVVHAELARVAGAVLPVGEPDRAAARPRPDPGAGDRPARRPDPGERRAPRGRHRHRVELPVAGVARLPDRHACVRSLRSGVHLPVGRDAQAVPRPGRAVLRAVRTRPPPRRDYSAAGKVVGTYNATISCSTDRSTDPEVPCRVQVIKLAR